MDADARNSAILFAALALLLAVAQAAGEESPLKIVVNPNASALTLGEGPVILSVKTPQKNVKYAWALDGPGQLQGEGSTVLYILPEQLDASPARVAIAVTVTNQAGQRQDARVVLTLRAPAATPAPTNTPEPGAPGAFSLDDLEQAANAEREARTRWEAALKEMERARAQVEAYERQDSSASLKIAAWERFLSVFAEENPHSMLDDELRRLAAERIHYWRHSATGDAPPAATAPSPSEIERWQQEADAYFAKQRFLLPPERNAFDLDKKILQHDPANARARQQIFDMMRLYRQWGDEQAAQRRADRATTFYERYLTLAAYAAAQFPNQRLAKEIERVKAQLRQLAAPPKPEAARATATPAPQPFTVWSDPATGIPFVWLPGGCFQMGSPPDEPYRDLDESPTHEVCLQGFWMGKYEVTQAQWLQVMGRNPAYFVEQAAGQTALILPVEQVSWHDAQEFLQKLNAASRSPFLKGNAHPSPLPRGETQERSPLGRGEGWVFRLPSEAEWEYACRAGTSTPYSFGDDPNLLGEYAWHRDNSDAQTHPVGERAPNAWGLHDMHGNVWEWCADSWHDTYLSAPSDGAARQAASRAERRVLRGGAWNNLPWFLRCADRLWDQADKRNFTRGLRVVRAR